MICGLVGIWPGINWILNKHILFKSINISVNVNLIMIYNEHKDGVCMNLNVLNPEFFTYPYIH